MRVPFLTTVILCSALWGQDDGAPVVVDGQEVARIYGSVGSFTAAERAAAIRDRITALAEKGFAGKIATRDIPSEKSTAIVAGPAILMAVTEAQAEALGTPRGELAKQYALTIQQMLEGYGVRHSWSRILLALLKTVIAWSLYFTLAWALWKSTRWLSARMETWFNRYGIERRLRGIHRVAIERGTGIAMTIVKVAAVIFLLFAFSFVVSFTFGLYPQTAGISTTLMDYLGAAFGRIGTAILHYLPSGGFVFVVCVLTRYFLRLLRFVTEAIERGDLPVGIHGEMARPTYQIVRLAVILFALVVAFPYLPGGQSEAFKGVSIFIGLLLSLGSSSAVSNVLAGLVLTYMRPFHNGDRVKIADTVGDVLEKTLLVTRVRTIKNVEVVIPNGAILGNQILNYSALARTRGLILHTTVTIGYDAPWRTVHELLVRAALSTEGVLPEPAPFILQTSLNDFHISYELNAYTDRANELQDTYSRLHQAIQDSFNEGGIEIMSPTFYALRDGNTVTIPAAYRPADYESPSFHVRDTTARAISAKTP